MCRSSTSTISASSSTPNRRRLRIRRLSVCHRAGLRRVPADRGVFSCYRPVERRPRNTRVPAVTDRGRLEAPALSRARRQAPRIRRIRASLHDHGRPDLLVRHPSNGQLSSTATTTRSTTDFDATVKGSEMISELYVRRRRPGDLHGRVREDARRHGMNIIYGTIRLIEKDDESVLAWAREPWACIVFNLHVDHCPSGIRKAAARLPALHRSRRGSRMAATT